MNIFYLHSDPKQCAREHIDAHVRKMCVEYAQILSTAHFGGPTYNEDTMYKPFNPNHPSNLWVKASYINYIYVFDLLCYLCDEYTHRFRKKHRSSNLIRPLLKVPTHIPYALVPMTKKYQAMPPEYRHNDPVFAYRRYYIAEKQTDKNGKDIWKWTRRNSPIWVRSPVLKPLGDGTKSSIKETVY